MQEVYVITTNNYEIDDIGGENEKIVYATTNLKEAEAKFDEYDNFMHSHPDSKWCFACTLYQCNKDNISPLKYFSI